MHFNDINAIYCFKYHHVRCITNFAWRNYGKLRWYIPLPNKWMKLMGEKNDYEMLMEDIVFKGQPRSFRKPSRLEHSAYTSPPIASDGRTHKTLSLQKHMTVWWSQNMCGLLKCLRQSSSWKTWTVLLIPFLIFSQLMPQTFYNRLSDLGSLGFPILVI